jgi:transcriptional regulator with XRE-family HTH domain
MSEGVQSNRDRVIALRHEHGLTQREAAAILGVSQTILALYESGRRRWPEERELRTIAVLEDWAPDVQHSEEERTSYLEQMRRILDDFNRHGWPTECR